MSYVDLDPLSAFTSLPSTWLAQLLANTEALHDGTGFASNAIPSSALDYTNMGWKQIGRQTLSSVGSTIDLSGMPAMNYLKVFVHIAASGGAVDTTLTFNNDSGSNYAFRYSPNFTTETASTSQTGIPLESGSEDNHHFTVMDVINFSSLEKIYMFFNIRAATAGASTNVQTLELRGKYASGTQVTRLTATTSANNFAAGSEILVLGKN